jgi:translation initiation factor IF-2
MAQDRQIIEVPDFLTVRELAALVGSNPIVVMKQLINNGIMVSLNQQIDYETAEIVLSEMGYEARSAGSEEADEADADSLPAWKRLYADEDPRQLVRRPPVVTILGHVDHGKTSLLDAIRKANVADGEAGGITQHIGAYQVNHNGRKITFLDTPGHAAFTAMRARGAQGADVAVLVVAADDGVMPTTREAIAHARAAKVPMIVALNKIDKRNANPDRVKQELSELDLTADDWGGNTMVVPVSARDKTGIDDLLEAVLLTADEAQIYANPKGKTAGTVIEARMEKSRGVLATLLVQNGTLHTGDVVVLGTASGRIRAMFDEKTQPIKEAPPSTPVQVMGLPEIPDVGAMFTVAKNEKEARAIVEERLELLGAPEAINANRPTTLEDFFKQMKAGNAKELLIILKTDVQGSLEPLVNSLKEIKVEQTSIKILFSEVGNIGENDINLAISTGAIVLGFNVVSDNAAQRLAEAHNVEIRNYNIIYNLLEDVEKALKGLLDPVYEDKVIGVAQVLKVFKIPKIGKIAGSKVIEGEIKRSAKARVRRGRELLAEALSVSSLKRETEDVREIKSGFECGISVDGFEDFYPGDLIEFVVRERVR